MYKNIVNEQMKIRTPIGQFVLEIRSRCKARLPGVSSRSSDVLSKVTSSLSGTYVTHVTFFSHLLLLTLTTLLVVDGVLLEQRVSSSKTSSPQLFFPWYY